MPENPSPFDDPLADLYGKLPDPRRERGAEGEATPPPTRRAARAAAQGDGRDAERVRETPAPIDDAAGADGSPVTPRMPATTPRPAPRTPETRPAARAGATGTLEDLFTGEKSTDDIGRAPTVKERRRGRAAGWIVLGLVLVLIGGVASAGLWVWNANEDRIRAFMGWEEPNDFEPGMANGEATITIVSGDSGQAVSQKMYDAGVTKTPEALYDYMVRTASGFTFQPGVFRLQQQMTAQAALEALGNPANRMEGTARLPEGLTVDQTVARLSEQLQIPLPELEAAVADPSAYGVSGDSLEGWLFPATYDFNPDTPASDVIQRMVTRTVQSLDSAGVPEGDRHRILTIASIIQREARFENDFYRVSRVIQNRLDPNNGETSGLLQMDSTAQYGYGEMHAGTASSSAEALADPNLWNTYVHPGLPIGPIANPGDLAIDAAMHPADGPWLYFVTVNLDTGETVFTTTYADHDRAVNQWRAWCRENPDSGC